MPQHLDRAFLRVHSPPIDRNSGARLGTKRSLFSDENTLLSRSATTSFDCPHVCNRRLPPPRSVAHVPLAGMRVDRSS